MTTVDDLLGEIFDGKRPALYRELEGWVRGSHRFKAFATTYRSKIRSKLRNARDERTMKDVRAELQTAALPAMVWLLTCRLFWELPSA